MFRQPVEEIVNSDFKPAVICWKIDHVSHLWWKVWVNIYSNLFLLFVYCRTFLVSIYLFYFFFFFFLTNFLDVIWSTVESLWLLSLQDLINLETPIIPAYKWTSSNKPNLYTLFRWIGTDTGWRNGPLRLGLFFIQIHTQRYIFANSVYWVKYLCIYSVLT